MADTDAHLNFVHMLHRVLPAGDVVVWSPYAVAAALALVAGAARGRTRDELLGLLHADPDRIGRELAAAAAPDGAEAGVADTLWLDGGLPVAAGYAERVRGRPGGAVRHVPFADRPAAARDLINADVAATTRGLVPQLLPAGSIRPDTAALLTAALYLKVAWRIPFPRRDTAPAPFHAPGRTVDVPMMRRRGRMAYAEVPGWRMAGLATAGAVRVDILLGDAPGVPEPDVLAALTAVAAPSTVDLALPRLRAAGRVDLTAPLSDLGVRAVFSRDADLSGLTPRRVRLDSVRHETVLRVDEDGVEGAAATAAAFGTVALDLSRPVRLVVDRPYLLLVRHAESGLVYFLARVDDPGT